jgi:Leucine-rich repeat (LRR) protein
MQTVEEFLLDDDDRYGEDTDDVRSCIRNWIDRKNPEYQINLKRFNIHTLPPLPDTIKNLIIGNRNLVYIATLPSSLVNFSCTYCDSVRRIPDLPNNGLTVNFTGSGITKLPRLPNTIQRVIAAETRINEIPYFYTGIQEIIISGTGVRRLPYISLPSTMFELDISNTQIKRLPRLNRGLKILNISNTKISVLPPLPFSLANLYVNTCDNLIIQRNNTAVITESIQSYGERWDEWYRSVREKIRAEDRVLVFQNELADTVFRKYLRELEDITA